MNVIFDEGVPRKLATVLRERGCPVATFPNGWKGTRNGRLLQRVKAAGSDCLMTCDRNMRHQQNIRAAGVAIIVLPSQDLESLIASLDRIVDACFAAAPGEVRMVRMGLDQDD